MSKMADELMHVRLTLCGDSDRVVMVYVMLHNSMAKYGSVQSVVRGA